MVEASGGWVGGCWLFADQAQMIHLIRDNSATNARLLLLIGWTHIPLLAYTCEAEGTGQSEDPPPINNWQEKITGFYVASQSSASLRSGFGSELQGQLQAIWSRSSPTGLYRSSPTLNVFIWACLSHFSSSQRVSTYCSSGNSSSDLSLDHVV